MASVKYGAIVTEIKGKVGGSVFQSSNAGFSVKNKGNAKGRGDTATRAQDDLQRIRFSQVVKAWSTLSAAERNSWGGLVGIWTFKNKFGDTYNGSPYQIFNACNINALILELPIFLSAPIFNAAVDPMISYSDYSISGDFEQTRGNAAAIGMKSFNTLSFVTTPTKSLSRTRTLGSNVSTYLDVGTFSNKALYMSFFGGNPPLGSIFYITRWYAFPDYPNKAFYQVYKINVVA